jgi:hypothetical protein
MSILVMVLIILMLEVVMISCDNKMSERLYTHQFPPGSEHLILPELVVFSIYMGKIKYEHMPLLLESMKFNPKVQFIVINIITEPNDTDEIEAMKQRHGVENFLIVRQSIADFTQRVNERLGIRVPFAADWFYKMCDYKPTIAYLYPEYVVNKPYKFWGYADMDVVWGNISRFAYWFQGQYPFVISGKSVRPLASSNDNDANNI